MSIEFDLRSIQEAQSGDAQSFARLVEGHYRSVYGLAYSTVGDWAAAEDIAQETFLVAWTHLGSLRVQQAFGAWLRQIVRNLSISWLRSKNYRDKLVQRRETLCPTASEVENEARAHFAAEDRKSELWQALESLPQSLREAVVLYYLEDKSVAEVAAALGIAPNAVSKRLQRARHALRSYIEAQWAAELAEERKRRSPDEASRRFLAVMPLGVVDPRVAAGAAKVGLGLWGASLSVPAWLATLYASMAMKTVAVLGAVAIMAAVVWNLSSADSDKAKHVLVTNTSVQSKQVTSSTQREQARSTSDAAPDEQSTHAHSTDTTPPAVVAAAQGSTEETPQVPIEGRIRVLDKPGNPIAGAKVTAVQLRAAESALSTTAERWASFRESATDPSRSTRALTDADGYATLKLPGMYDPNTPIRVRVEAEGYRPAITRFSFPDARDVRLEQGVVLEGIVLDRYRHPVTDACLGVLAVATENYGIAGKTADDTPTAETDARGRFHTFVQLPGKCVLYVASLSQGQRVFADVPCGTDEITELIYPAPATIAGRITSTDGSSLSGTTIMLQGSAVPSEPWSSRPPGFRKAILGSPDPYVAKIDEGGYYEIKGIAGGLEYTADFRDATGNTIASARTVGLVSPGERLIWNYAIEGAPIVRGTLNSETTGQPMSGFPIRWRKEEQEIVSDNGVETKTDADGKFELKPTAGPGVYVLTPLYPSRARSGNVPTAERAYEQRVTVENGEAADVALVLPDPWSWRVHVVDADGTPAQIPDIHFQETSENGSQGSQYYGHTDASGWITLENLPPGVDCQVCCALPSGPMVCTPKHKGASGETAPEETLVLYRSAGAQGTLIDNDGAAIANARIAILVRDERGQEKRIETTTDADGRFVVNNEVFATSVTVNIRDVGNTPYSGAHADLGPFDVKPGQDLDLGTVQLLPENQ